MCCAQSFATCLGSPTDQSMWKEFPQGCKFENKMDCSLIQPRSCSRVASPQISYLPSAPFQQRALALSLSGEYCTHHHCLFQGFALRSSQTKYITRQPQKEERGEGGGSLALDQSLVGKKKGYGTEQGGKEAEMCARWLQTARGSLSAPPGATGVNYSTLNYSLALLYVQVIQGPSGTARERNRDRLQLFLNWKRTSKKLHKSKSES